MSKQYKKLQRKLHPQKNESKQPEKPVGKDYVLIAVIAFLIVMLVSMGGYMDKLNLSMYILLLISMCCTYAQRHFKLSENTEIYVMRAGQASIGLAIALFLVSLYYQLIA